MWLFLHGKHFLCDTNFCFRIPVASTGLCDLLWGTADQHGEEQRWVFSQQNWPAFHRHAAEACSEWGGLPQIASTSREERMTSTYFRFSSFSYRHHLLPSCSWHFPLVIRQLDSLQSDFWLSPFKLCFNKWIKYFQGPPQTNLSLFWGTANLLGWTGWPQYLRTCHAMCTFPYICGHSDQEISCRIK